MSLRAPAAGAAYFLLVFPAGFLLGTVRTLAVAPQVGEVAAVALEVPVMLAVAWFACGWVLHRMRVDASVFARIVMGAVALGLLLAAEAMVSLILGKISLQEHFESYTEAGPLIGLAAQLLYACFPFIRRDVA